MSWADKIKQNHAGLAELNTASLAEAEALQKALDIAPQETQDAVLKALGLAIEDKANGGRALVIAGKLLQTAVALI